jgi:hypothetical protein
MASTAIDNDNFPDKIVFPFDPVPVWALWLVSVCLAGQQGGKRGDQRIRTGRW